MRSRWVRRRGRLFAYRHRPVSGLGPSQPRPRRRFERQRRAALEMVVEQRPRIREAAARHGVAEEAIAGAILWEALENPYVRRFLRLGPGKVGFAHLTRPSAAELAERAGLVEHSPRSALQRRRLLQRPPPAIDYIAAILAQHAADYREIAGVEIGADAGVLCTLYQGGESDLRAARLARRRAVDPNAMPHAADEMGPWVECNIDFIRAALRGESSVERSNSDGGPRSASDLARSRG